MKKFLLSTVAASAFLLITGGAVQAYDDPNIDLSGASLSQVQASQTMNATISGSAVVEGSATQNTNYFPTHHHHNDDNGDTDSTMRTGDINYNSTTMNAAGVYTLQNQTGINNAGNNGTNIAVQTNSNATDSNIGMSGASVNAVNAAQSLTSDITNSPVTVSTQTSDEAGTLNRTGDVNYHASTFDATGLFTLQNQTGLNNAGNNGTNLSAQVNSNADESINLDGQAVNQVVAIQGMSATIDPSNVTVTNTSSVEDMTAVPSRTGDVTYSQSTFNAPGLFTLQNNTGLNVAANNGSQFSVQYNSGAADSVDLDDASKNLVLASQSLGATVSGSTVSVMNNVDSSAASRTGDVTYASSTFNAPGVFAISNNTGMNNAANNALNVSVQVNGGI